MRAPIFYTDFILCIEPRPGHEIAIYKIKEFSIDLQRRGYPIAKVSADGYQSANLRQDLLLAGINAEIISVDKTKDPYYNLRTAILESRYNGVSHEILDQELRALIDAEKKIDHPVKGSKDLADSVCGSLWSAYSSQDEHFSITPDEYSAAFEKFLDEGEDSHYERILSRAGAVYNVYR